MDRLSLPPLILPKTESLQSPFPYLKPPKHSPPSSHFFLSLPNFPIAFPPETFFIPFYGSPRAISFNSPILPFTLSLKFPSANEQERPPHPPPPGATSPFCPVAPCFVKSLPFRSPLSVSLNGRFSQPPSSFSFFICGLPLLYPLGFSAPQILFEHFFFFFSNRNPA